MLSSKKIKEVEELASLHFKDAEILLITGITEICQTFRNSVKKGKLMSEAKVRKSVFEMAEAGSGPAQTLAVKIIEQNK
jgi:hypothetical protein